MIDRLVDCPQMRQFMHQRLESENLHLAQPRSSEASSRLVLLRRSGLPKESDQDRHVRLALHTVNDIRVNRNQNTRNQQMLLAPEAQPTRSREGLNRDWYLCRMIGQ